ncbi:hypothetical protein [Roseateles sp. LKC17W]|uniref:HEAT repeat domain-containing protein n=1 Tax=Pelomonas margarita TaxID=3299031 RepID=A0ABW7FN92_9BURK
MNRELIHDQIVAVAERFGSGNTQEFKLLAKQLAACDSVEVVDGLLLVFSRSNAGESNYQKQQLAGRLLAKLKPKAPVDLQAALEAVLPAYNPSIEELPFFLADRCGGEAVLQALRRLETGGEDPRHQAAAKTMRWWLKGSNVE